MLRLGPLPSDPFTLVEFYGYRLTSLVLFFVGLYRLIKREVRK